MTETMIFNSYYYTLQDIFDLLQIRPNDNFVKLLSMITQYQLNDVPNSEYFYQNYLVPRALYDVWVITNKPLEMKNMHIINVEVIELFNKMVSKINGFFSTYGKLINEYEKSIDELITNGVATSINKSHTNDTPESVQTDKYDEKYASQTIKQETTIQDNSGILIDKLNNYQNKIEDIYEMLYNEIDKMIVGDVYELWQN